MNELLKEIGNRCRSEYDDIVAIRRDIHMHPEIKFEGERTSEIAATELEKTGITVRRHIGKIGVMGDLNVAGATRRIALRADMDALPMTEQSDLPYRSTIDGRAHTCGHDVHTANLIGTARVLWQLKDRLKVNVRFIFQPNEEQPPGGALGMIEDGALDGVDEIYGLHVFPIIPAGQIGIAAGPAMAQADFFNITIYGKGGHGAMPHRCIDPVIIGSQYVTQLQTIVSRSTDPLDSAVISVTQFNAGTSYNIIPDRAELAGTVRTLRKEVQQSVRQKLEDLLAGITSANDATYELTYTDGYPVTVNDDRCVSRVIPIAQNLFGETGVQHPVPPSMGGEDFSYYAQQVPGCFLWLGAGNPEKGIVHAPHHPQFNVDETCIKHGMSLLAAIVLT
ncbi:MAG: amidohydrolase [Deltaproteobacteria bacterium]|nr:amidohydrolase [Deltaproteobacteria bacterium]